MFKKASKKQAKLRLAILAPSGSGKTMSALRIAKGIGGKVAVIDTERGSASKYSDRFDFDVCELEDYSINSYVEAIQGAAGYNVLIIDSLSHAWQELLQEVEKIAQAKFKGNTWSAWSRGTPMQRKLIDTLLNFNGHIIATMRAKTEWITEVQNGKQVPKKVGVGAEQGKGIEYEFDMLMEITVDHYATFTKDRSGKFQDRAIEKPDEKLGQEMVSWLNEGEELPPPVSSEVKAQDAINEAKSKIKKCKTQDELRVLWQSLPKEIKVACEEAKEQQKADLTALSQEAQAAFNMPPADEVSNIAA